jgi:demethylmenaquinone methyltransferase/2-methoxy-6-polyprenyl-1,4-benzoquinol methylase
MEKESEGLIISFWSSLYDKVTSLIGYSEEFRRENLRLINFNKLLNQNGRSKNDKIRIVDIGCGTGALLIEAINFVKLPAELELIGIDPDQKMLDIATFNIIKLKRKKKIPNYIKINFKKGYVENILEQSCSIDVVLSSMTTHHFSRKLKYQGFKEIYRVLKPGGIYLNADFGIYNPKPNISWKIGFKIILFLYFNVIETIFGDFKKSTFDHFTNMIPRLLEKVGFKSIKYLNSHFRRAIFIEAIK